MAMVIACSTLPLTSVQYASKIMNDNWQKEKCGSAVCHNDTTLALVVQKVAEHTDTLSTLTKDIGEIKNSLSILISKLEGFNPNAVLLQETKIITLEGKVKDVEDELRKVSKKIIYWSGIGAVLVFICGYLIMPAIVNKISPEPAPVVLKASK